MTESCCIKKPVRVALEADLQDLSSLFESNPGLNSNASFCSSSRLIFLSCNFGQNGNDDDALVMNNEKDKNQNISE